MAVAEVVSDNLYIIFSDDEISFQKITVDLEGIFNIWIKKAPFQEERGTYKQ